MIFTKIFTKHISLDKEDNIKFWKSSTPGDMKTENFQLAAQFVYHYKRPQPLPQSKLVPEHFMNNPSHNKLVNHHYYSRDWATVDVICILY